MLKHTINKLVTGTLKCLRNHASTGLFFVINLNLGALRGVVIQQTGGGKKYTIPMGSEELIGLGRCQRKWGRWDKHSFPA